MLSRDVQKYLQDWGYSPLSRDDFGRNFLSARLGSSRERVAAEVEGQRLPASLCAVPRGRPRERVDSLANLSAWLDPNVRQYQPPGRWIPFRSGKPRFTSLGLLLSDDDYEAEGEKGWEAYLFVGRDGYVEFGRKAGFPVRGRPFFPFAPLVAWAQRFTAFVLDLVGQLKERPDYELVLNIMNTQGAVLGVFGHGWREPWDGGWLAGELRSSIERNVQISRTLGVDEPPEIAGRWFAERIGNAFGHSDGTLRFNHPNSKDAPANDLPANKCDF